jgi:hypothetical protein
VPVVTFAKRRGTAILSTLLCRSTPRDALRWSGGVSGGATTQSVMRSHQRRETFSNRLSGRHPLAMTPGARAIPARTARQGFWAFCRDACLSPAVGAPRNIRRGLAEHAQAHFGAVAAASAVLVAPGAKRRLHRIAWDANQHAAVAGGDGGKPYRSALPQGGQCLTDGVDRQFPDQALHARCAGVSGSSPTRP